MGFWLVVVVLSVLFTPSFQVMGTVPVRLDDVLIFGGGGYFLCKSLVSMRMPKFDPIVVSLIAVVISIFVSTFSVSMSSPDLITPKEYLDLVRPLKWLFLYWQVAEIGTERTTSLILRTLYRSWLVMLGLCVFEILLGKFLPDSPIAQFLANFRNGEEWHGVGAYMESRPFGTLESPTTLGYLATIGIFLGYLYPERSKRIVFTCVSCALLILTMTRTFLFALPVLFAIYSFIRSDNLRKAARGIFASTGILVVLAFIVLIVMPLISSANAELTNGVISSVATGSTTSDNPLGTRIANLSLVATTWNRAPWLGVATRAFLPEYVDSELIITFHRYGLIGLFALMSIYPAGILIAWKVRRFDHERAACITLILLPTFLYGFTQGALINSRAGALPYILLGLITAHAQKHQNRNLFKSSATKSDALICAPAPGAFD
jgi:hypothetical protein